MLNDVINIAPSFYGMSMVPPQNWENYGYALLIMAGSDGDVSEPEMDWLVVKAAKSVGIPEDIIEKWRAYDFENGNLEEEFFEINSMGVVSFSKLLIYDAIRMAAADGEYSDDEREKVCEAANILKIKQKTLLSIEALIEMEMALDKMRLNIF